MEGKKRLEQILNVYENLEKVLDSLPEQIPTAIRNTIKDSILNDKELKETFINYNINRDNFSYFFKKISGKNKIDNLC